jgi:hypothetical protein
MARPARWEKRASGRSWKDSERDNRAGNILRLACVQAGEDATGGGIPKRPPHSLRGAGRQGRRSARRPSVSPSPEGGTLVPGAIKFALQKSYQVGDRVVVKIVNEGSHPYLYNSTGYEACNLTYRDQTGREFIILPGTHCDLVLMEASVGALVRESDGTVFAPHRTSRPVRIRANLVCSGRTGGAPDDGFLRIDWRA